MKENALISHDILNMIERLRIMHDLIKRKNYDTISREEIEVDLDVTLKKLKEDFELLLSRHQ